MTRYGIMPLVCLAMIGTAGLAWADDADSAPRPVEAIKTSRSLDQIEAQYEDIVSSVACHTYEMAEYNDPYSSSYHVTGPGHWGHHALQWKGYRLQTWLGPAAVYDPFQAATLNPPEWQVECGDEVDLDDLESPASYTYFSTIVSAPIDPAGTWICESEADPEAGAILAALGMYYWQSPSYLNMQGYVTGQYPHAGVIEKVTLCAVGTSDLPHEVCGWDSAGPFDSLANLNACAGSLVLDSVEFSFWGDIPIYGYFPHVTVNGADWASLYGYAWLSPTDIILDPPEGTSDEDIASMSRLAQDAASKVLVLSEGELILAD